MTRPDYLRIVRRAASGLALSGLSCLVSACSCGSDDGAPNGGSGETPNETLACGACCLAVEDGAARSCQILLTGTPVEPARFSQAVRGSARGKGDRYAVAFTAAADRSVAGRAVAFSGDAGACPVEMVSATCYDRQGRVIPNSTIKLSIPGSGR